MTVVMCSIRRELSPLEYSVSHSTQAAAYTHAHPNRPLFGKRQRGINTLHLGCANFSPVPQRPGLDEWHTTGGAGNRPWISRSQASTLNNWAIPDSSTRLLHTCSYNMSCQSIADLQKYKSAAIELNAIGFMIERGTRRMVTCIELQPSMYD